ncbi:ATP-binding response regulator [Aestuariispira insulae]|uniref:histidine kinase n=1 Tax=Aestuariispira insulae TaxID=1461337 RepID=A0A3D9H2T9_9PROT|nr:response regulator [Aestuariispira insulae]RED43805.1 CheY-like chemotaxis protein [Aestuariispira insulae]
MRFGILGKFALVSGLIYGLILVIGFTIGGNYLRTHRMSEEITSLAASAHALRKALPPYVHDKNETAVRNLFQSLSGNRSVDCLWIERGNGVVWIVWPSLDCQAKANLSSAHLISLPVGNTGSMLKMRYSDAWIEEKLYRELSLIVIISLLACLSLLLLTSLIFQMTVGRGLSHITRVIKARRDSGSARLARWQSGDEIGLIARMYNEMLREESRRRAQSSKLRRDRDNAEIKATAKSEVVANIGHELRTPLAVLEGTVRHLTHQPHSLNQASHFSKLSKSSLQLKRLLEDFQILADLDHADNGPTHSSFSLADLLEEISEDLPTQAFEGAPDINIHADRTLIRMIITKTIKMMSAPEESHAPIQVTASTGTKPLLIFRFSGHAFSNDTVGEDPYLMPFKAFADIGDQDKKQNHDMILLEKLLHKTNGRLSRDALADGAITIHLPIELLDVNLPPKPAQSHTRGTIMVVDDSPTNLFIIEDLLVQAGFDVKCFNSAATAIEQCDKGRFSAVFMDLSMPGMDGYEATAALRHKLGADMPPVIALTAHVSLEIRQRCKEAGMRGFLSKPLDEQAVLATLTEFLTAPCQERIKSVS